MTESGRGKRIAILIGTNEYLNVDQLQFAENDAKEMGEVLLDQNICGFDEVIELIDKTKEEVSHRIEKAFKNARKDDEILIYFSGHGKPSYKFDLCLLFKDTDPESLLATSLKFDYINECKDQSSCNRVVVILDCCYSGTAGMKGDFLQEMLSTYTGSGTVLLTSTGQTGSNIAKEDKELEHGVFTHYLLKGLRDWAADYDNDGVITVDDLYKYTFNETKAKGLQRPQKKGSYEGEMILGRNPQKIKDREFEQKKEKLIQYLSSAPSFALYKSLTILQKMYRTPFALEPEEVKIKPHLESLLEGEIQAETYVEIVKYQEKTRKLQEEEQKQKERLERDYREKDKPERLLEQRVEELQKQNKETGQDQREEEKKREEKELLERKQEDEETPREQEKGEGKKELERIKIEEAGKSQEAKQIFLRTSYKNVPPEKPDDLPGKGKPQTNIILVGVIFSLIVISAAIWLYSQGNEQPLTPLTIKSFNANPEIVTYGENITLNWSVLNATLVTITPGIGEVALSGSISVNPAKNTTYSLTATNKSGNNVTKITTVYCFKKPKIMSFDASPATIVHGQNSTLSWSVSGDADVTITPEIGDVPLTGSKIVKPLRGTTYTLTATNRAGDNVTGVVTIRQQAVSTSGSSEGEEGGSNAGGPTSEGDMDR